MSEVDITKTVAPKTDQLNADDFIGSGDRAIKITAVKMMDSKEQPIAISYEGDNGKPWKPSLGMRRVLIELWGQEAAKEASKYYPGRSLVLYRDPNVKFGKDTVGGIRIRSASDISSEQKMVVTVSKARRVEFVVKPMGKISAPNSDVIGISVDDFNALQNAVNNAHTPSDYKAAVAKVKEKYDDMSDKQAATINEILKSKREEIKASLPKCEKCAGAGYIDNVDPFTGEETRGPCICQKP